MGRNHLAHASGDAINAVLAAAGYNFRRLLAWLKLLLLRILIALGLAAQLKIALKPSSSQTTVESGVSRNAAARQFAVSVSCVVKLMQRFQHTGSVLPAPRGKKPYALEGHQSCRVKEPLLTNPASTRPSHVGSLLYPSAVTFQVKAAAPCAALCGLN
jgi:hypothetical protein